MKWNIEQKESSAQKNKLYGCDVILLYKKINYMSATLFQHTKNVIICARWQSRAQKNCLYVHDTYAILKNEKNCGIAIFSWLLFLKMLHYISLENKEGVPLLASLNVGIHGQISSIWNLMLVLCVEIHTVTTFRK